MEYLEISFTCESVMPTDIIHDILASELGKIGFDSFIPDENVLLAYIDANKFSESSLKECLDNFPLHDIRFFYTQQLIKSRNWNEEWEKNYFKPILIENDCRIRASFHPEVEGIKYPIVIDPKMAFGTGNHATTYLMLSELLKLDLHDKKVLDMGCGTAVIAILAAMKDASQVVAIDNDEWAYNNAIENCRLNHMEQIEVTFGGAEQIERFGSFDYIFANINRNILLEDMHRYVPALKQEGVIFMSGFFKEDIPAIEAESKRNGLFLSTFAARDNWVSTRFARDKGLRR